MTNEEPHPSDSRLGCLHFLAIMLIWFFFFRPGEKEKEATYENI